MLVGDRHPVMLLELAHSGAAQVVGDAVGCAVDEPEVQSGVAILDETLAERPLVGDERACQPHHVIECLRDVARLTMLVPFLQTGDDLVDDVVEHGVRDLILVLEIVVEERSGHADVFGYVADRDFREALFQADCPCRLHDLRATGISDGAHGCLGCFGHGSPPIPYF